MSGLVHGVLQQFKPVHRRRPMERERLLSPVPAERVATTVLTPIRWAVILGILISLRVSFETHMNRTGLLAALAAYGSAAAFLPRLSGGRWGRNGSEQAMLATDWLMAALITRLSGGVLSPYFGLWYLAVLHAALLLRPLTALGVAFGTAAVVAARELYAPDDPIVLLHLYTMLAKLSILPLIAWAGGRLARELRQREVARRHAVRHAAASATEEVRIRQEMEAARRVQENLLPQILPAPAGMTLASLFLPAEAVGGDVYDAIELPDGRLLITVADVCGKGIPAAMLAVAVQHSLRQCAGPEPAAVLTELNRQLFGQCPDSMFVTAVCVVIDPRDGHVITASAGHPPPLHWEQEGMELASLRSRGMALGLNPEWTGQTDQITLRPGDALLLYTDGVVDSWIGRRERLGLEKLRERLGETPPDDAESWLARLRQTLSGCVAQPDDVTAVAVVRSRFVEARRVA